MEVGLGPLMAGLGDERGMFSAGQTLLGTFNHSIHIYYTHYVPGPVPGPGDLGVNKTKFPILSLSYI